MARKRNSHDWSRKISDDKIRLVGALYYAGSNVRDVTAQFGICRSTLYRYLARYKELTGNIDDAQGLRIANLEQREALADLSMKNHALSSQVKDLTEEVKALDDLAIRNHALKSQVNKLTIELQTMRIAEAKAASPVTDSSSPLHPAGPDAQAIKRAARRGRGAVLRPGLTDS